MKSIDVVIVSYAKNKECYDLTYNCIDSLFNSESEVNINAIIVESERGLSWENIFPNYSRIKTLEAPLPYSYHKFLNFGRKFGSSEYVALCNNDLVFHTNWFTNINEFAERMPEAMSFSPICPHTQPKMGIPINSGVYAGLVIRATISGWCIVQKRKIYEIIGDLDERYIHWYSDNDYAMQLKENHLNHFLVTSSVVEHHSNVLGRTTEIVVGDQEEIKKMTYLQEEIFNEKWKRNTKH